MIKKLVLIMSVFAMVISLASCSSSSKPYEGFNDIPPDYTSEQAIADGCYVLENLTSIGGEEAKENFYKDVDSGKDSFLRTMYIYDQDNKYTIAYGDLIYKNGSYTYYDSSAEEIIGSEFKYFLRLSGVQEEGSTNLTLSVLTDDENLSFEDVVKGITSNNSEVLNSISPFKIIFVE